MLKIIKKQANMLLPIYPKVDVGNNCPVLNVFDVLPQMRRIDTYN